MNKLLGMMLISAVCLTPGFGQTASRTSARTTVRAVEQTVEGSVLHLKGAVEIRTGKMVVRADEATFDVASGIINATGNLSVTKAGVEATPRRVAPEVKRLRMDVNRPDQVVLMIEGL